MFGLFRLIRTIGPQWTAVSSAVTHLGADVLITHALLAESHGLTRTRSLRHGHLIKVHPAPRYVPDLRLLSVAPILSPQLKLFVETFGQIFSLPRRVPWRLGDV